MIPAKPFYMIRHGETEANLACILQGQTDTPLTDLGREQARSVHDAIHALEAKPTAIIHSNILRARNTAEIINEALNVPMHEDSGWAEIYAGDKEGAPYEECMDFLYGFETPINGETWEDFFKRIGQAAKRSLESHEGPVLIVTHGGVFRGFGGAHGLKVLKITDNCVLCEFQPNPEKSPFPWDVYSYDYDETQNRVIRVKETLYDDTDN